jgi:Leucine-rich repeat (LRR) protein
MVMNSEEINHDELDQDAANKEMLLKIFYNSKGSIDEINAAIDAKLFGTRVRSITLFEKFVRARLTLNPKVLRLVELDITAFETIYLGQYPGLENVEDLDLRKNQLGDEGLEALLISEKLGNLRKLDLRNNQITRKGMELLARTEKLEKLESLDLRSNKIGKAWETKLKSIGKFPNLSSLKTV